MTENKKDSYELAGVDIDGANETLKAYANLAKSTSNDNVIADIGPFGGAFSLNNYKQPILISSTDGVGTKLLLAKSTNKLKMIGEDLVNHCVNDVMCAGANPLFFLDYIGAGPKLSQADRIELVEGMAKACSENNVALVGGETADLPDLYLKDAFDIVGFLVGAVEKENMIDGNKIAEGDMLFGVPSNGLQTNGFSIIRKIWNLDGSVENDSKILNVNDKKLSSNLGEALMQPHLSYKNLLDKLIGLDSEFIRGIAHITGGGIALNLERIIPKDFTAVVNLNEYEIPILYNVIKEKGSLSFEEMFKIFNMGIGMILVINKDLCVKYQNELSQFLSLGQIIKNENDKTLVRVESKYL